MEVFSKAKIAGQLMLQKISHDDNTQANYPTQSIFDRPESREENAWHIYINHIEVSSVFHILEHIRKITNSNFEKNWIGILARHLDKTDSTLGQNFGDKNGHFYYAMNAKFTQGFVTNGIIIATDSKSPYFIKQSKAKASEPLEKISTTTLQTWSDITYLSWHEECTQTSTPLKNLKHIIRSHITNSETTSVIKEILKEEKIMCPPDGLTVDINDSKGYGAALLGTPNGKGIGWLLSQHKNQLGNPKIVSVEIFHSLQVGFDDCHKDTGELIAGRENMREVEDSRDYLNLDFTIRCG
ncbi:putative wd domain-containing protein [Botrytis fragariae]|uniref:Putative wd domain-containing protein n=1 Tax=Botrytis fragariae TaxID=1964551 RepID=A0A8H6EHR4_9HELO|nr:putative wd domain-containing protein [Botrytis fragariae]KAF5872717.1 putative wd domain-containing protein [Botrytis fragariae]